MRTLFILITLLLFWGCGSRLALSQTTINKEALIVGVSDYKGEAYDLDGVRRDRENMKILFEKWGFHVTLLADEHSMDIEKYLQDYSHLKETDSFIFYYSGHGYHTKDLNGDEDDGQDEALILSDGNENKFFIDDALFGYLNEISAKKLVLLDSCHSGTAFRSLNNSVKVKSIGEDEVSGVMKTRAFKINESQIAKGKYIIFSASQDKEQSLDSENGGLFTNALLKQFNNGGKRMDFVTLRLNVDEGISEASRMSNATPHHPKLSVSNLNLKYSSINQFFNLGIKKVQLKSKVINKDEIFITGKTRFKEKEQLSFQINTNGNRGYLSIYSIEKGEPFLLTQTTRPVSGILNFQEDFNMQDPIECYKDCTSCPTEQSSVYVVLSEKPLDNNLLKGQKFMEGSYDNFKPIVAKKDFIIY